MNKCVLLIIIIISLSGCELIYIGSKTPKKIHRPISYNQKTSDGVLHLFKAELDNDNSFSASDLIISADGSFYLAEERYEMIYSLDRLRRQIQKMPITKFEYDTINSNTINYKIEYDYLKTILYSTKLLDTLWYITNYRIGN